MKLRQIALAAAVLVGLILAAGGGAHAQAGAPWGIDSGRATDEDVFNSVSDFIKLKAARDALQSGVIDQLQAERQAELLGTAPDRGLLAALAPKLGKGFVDNVFPVALRLVKNPAVPCEIAGSLVADLLQTMRSQQLAGTGITDPADAPVGDTATAEAAFAASPFGQMLDAMKLRCLEDAFDACMLTGNGQHLVVDLVSTERLLQFFGRSDVGAFAAQAAYLFRRCTVYELRNHSTDKNEGAESAFTSEQDGKVVLLADVTPDAGGTFGGLEGPHKWEGPRMQDPVDVKETTTQCLSKSQYAKFTCGTVTVPYAASVTIDSGALAMVRNFTVPILTAAGQVSYTGGHDGHDALTLKYRPATAVRPFTIATPVITVTNPLNISSAAFGNAYEDQAQLEAYPVSGWQRGSYPVLFTAEISGSKQPGGSTVFSDTTMFQLVHCPGKYPADEINPDYELPPAPRLPAPGSGCQ